jgi:hypothetical protein
MDRRQFLGASAAVTTGLLGVQTASFLGRNAGVGSGVARAGSVTTTPPRATAVKGQVADVDGRTISVDLVAQDAVDAVRLDVTRREYPDGTVADETRSDPVAFDAPGDEATVEVVVPDGGHDSGRWFHEVYVARGGDVPAFVCESAPYRWRQRTEYGADRADRVTEGPGTLDREAFGRELAGNDYRLTYRWLDSDDRTWEVTYPLRRSVHEAALSRERGYARTFDESRSSPYARDLAASIATDAVSSNEDGVGAAASLSEGEWFDLLVRFVQGVRYARDAETTDSYDYNRTVEETLVDGVGDCKDKTHLLAGLLETSPLSCETAMLFQPAHVILGVAASDVPARYEHRRTVELGGREFVPIDGSLRFDVGEIPDRPITAAYGDEGWFHYDVEAIGRGLDRNVRDWIDQNFG